MAREGKMGCVATQGVQDPLVDYVELLQQLFFPHFGGIPLLGSLKSAKTPLPES